LSTRSGARHPSHLGLSDAPTPFRCPYAQPVDTTEMWPCSTACCSWQFELVSLARDCSSIRGFHRSRLRGFDSFSSLWLRSFPGFVLSQALLLSCVALHLQPKGQVLPLTARCFCSTLSGRYLSSQVYLHFPTYLTIISFHPINSSKSCCPLPVSALYE
jgi:hypothetical protein